MSNFLFNWQLQRDKIFNQKKNRLMSNYKINAEWSLACLWDITETLPEVIEICRNSTDGEILVSGTFKLMRGQSCLLQRKFIQLIESGFKTILVEMEYTVDLEFTIRSDYYSHTYYITGNISIPPRMEPTENAKIPFESLSELSRDFERLLDPKAAYYADVNLECGNASFSAHKNILCVRSPVFATMFATEMKEKRENKVDISDLSPHVLKTMLIYIYTGKTEELSVQSSGELLFAADKYQLQDLKRVCIEYLKSCVSVENVLNILVLGYLHDDDLKFFAMDFICNCRLEFEGFQETVEWKNLRDKRPSLAADLLIRMVESFDEKFKI